MNNAHFLALAVIAAAFSALIAWRAWIASRPGDRVLLTETRLMSGRFGKTYAASRWSLWTPPGLILVSGLLESGLLTAPQRLGKEQVSAGMVLLFPFLIWMTWRMAGTVREAALRRTDLEDLD